MENLSLSPKQLHLKAESLKMEIDRISNEIKDIQEEIFKREQNFPKVGDRYKDVELNRTYVVTKVLYHYCLVNIDSGGLWRYECKSLTDLQEMIHANPNFVMVK
jgi:hypothetical protein